MKETSLSGQHQTNGGTHTSDFAKGKHTQCGGSLHNNTIKRAKLREQCRNSGRDRRGRRLKVVASMVGNGKETYGEDAHEDKATYGLNKRRLKKLRAQEQGKGSGHQLKCRRIVARNGTRVPAVNF